MRFMISAATTVDSNAFMTWVSTLEEEEEEEEKKKKKVQRRTEISTSFTIVPDAYYVHHIKYIPAALQRIDSESLWVPLALGLPLSTREIALERGISDKEMRLDDDT